MQSMMLNNKIQNINDLQSSLRKVEEYLLSIPLDTHYAKFDAM